MALVALLRGINAGGHRTFRPRTLAEQLKNLEEAAMIETGKVVLTAAVAILAAMPSAASEKIVTLDTEASRVTFTLDATAHEVHGVLALRSGEVLFDPATGAASGEIVVQLAGASTGNTRRDRKMHEEVLETSKFPAAVFRVQRVSGRFAEDGISTLVIAGALNLHGSERPLELRAEVAARDGRVRAELEIPIPFVAWGLTDPSVFILRVAKVVNVHVVAEGRLHAAAPVDR